MDHLQDEAVQEKLPHLWELSVDDGHQGRKDGREGWGGHLGFHQAAAEQAPAALQILHACSQLSGPTAQERVGRYRSRISCCLQRRGLAASCRDKAALLGSCSVVSPEAFYGSLASCFIVGVKWLYIIMCT